MKSKQEQMSKAKTVVFSTPPLDIQPKFYVASSKFGTRMHATTVVETDQHAGQLGNDAVLLEVLAELLLDAPCDVCGC